MEELGLPLARVDEICVSMEDWEVVEPVVEAASEL